MAEYEQSGLAPGFKNQSGWLVFFGIVEIIIGALCALMLLLTLGMMALSASNPQFRTPAMSLRMTIPTASTYLAAGVFFIWLGVGTLMGRRWARAIMLVASWLWLIGGLIGMSGWLLLLPELIETTLPGASSTSAALRSSMTAFFTALTAGMVALHLVLPGVFVLFYGREDVKATFELKDAQPRWTDRCPLPVLAVSLALGYGALQCLFGLSYNAIPFFGQVLTGTAAAVVTLVTAVILGLLAREVCRLHMSAWWAVVAVCILGALSNILTFLQISLLDFFGELGFTGPQLELMRSMRGLESFNIPLWTTVGTAAGLGYLVYIRKYFAAGQDAGRGPLDNERYAPDPG